LHKIIDLIEAHNQPHRDPPSTSPVTDKKMKKTTTAPKPEDCGVIRFGKDKG